MRDKAFAWVETGHMDKSDDICPLLKLAGAEMCMKISTTHKN